MIRTILFTIILFVSFLSADDRPNFVLFISDDVSYDDIGCYGHPTIKTPSIDALAANGMRFDNAYLTTSSCSPSRCSIITGRYPHNTGAPELHSKLPDEQIRFTELLKADGYYTVLSGKNHMFGNKDRSFDKITGGGGPGKSDDWVKHVQERPKDKPFFFWFASADAHRNWQIGEDDPIYDPKDVVIPPFMIDSENTRKDLADYYHEVSRWDRYIGLVTEELRKQGELENTVIIVIADNGRPFPRSKSRLYDSGIKTPFVVHYPNLIKKAATTDSLVSVIDISATVLELAGVEKAEPIQGLSFQPILKDPAASIRDMVFSEHNWHVYQNHERMVRFGDFLYIKNNFPNRQNLCVEAIEFPAGEDLVAYHKAGKTNEAQSNIFQNPCPPEEFFQVSEDPHQLTNLIDEPAFAKQIATAREQLAKWTDQTGDTIPEKPTLDRGAPGTNGKRNPHREFPGAAAGAEKINHPGPITFP